MGMRITATTLLLAASATAVQGQGHGPDPIEVPLRIESGKLVVPVLAADGRELSFLLSTGNPVTIFSESTAGSLGATPRLELGGATVVTAGAATVSDEELTIEGVKFAGIVASNTLNEYDVLVDAPGGRLLLKEVGGRVDWPGESLSEPVRLRVMHGILLALDVTVNGTEYPAMLDLGATPTLANTPVAAAAGITEEGAVELKIGSMAVSGTPLRHSDHPLFPRWDPTGTGFVMVGAPVAYDCAIALSWVHRELRTCVQ